MKIQSLSIVVPTNKCVNNCPFCVSKSHDNDYDNQIKDPLFEQDYKERLEYSRDNGVNTIILTGTAEALQNKPFLEKFAKWNKELSRPFYVIELQTTGVYLDDKTLKWLREEIGVKTISLSVSDIFDNENNLNTIGVHKNLRFNLEEITKKIKEYGFNLRISLNVLDNLNHLFINDTIDLKYDFKKLFHRFTDLNADQVTFRQMWTSGNNTEIDNWINNHNIGSEFWDFLDFYIMTNGTLLGQLPFGAKQYSIEEVSYVIDDDCMSDKVVKEEMKYLILRENGKLYFLWDNHASLIF